MCTVAAEIHNDPSGSVLFASLSDILIYRSTTSSSCCSSSQINDGAGDGPYGPFWDCLWHFDLSGVEDISHIAYNFTLFDLEFQYDFVSVFDGPNILAPTIFKASGAVSGGSYFGETTGTFNFSRFSSYSKWVVFFLSRQVHDG